MHPGKKEPKCPEYADKSARKASFSNWKHENHQEKKTFTEQGLFYTGRGDLVRCFHCGIGLKDFSPEDDPLIEHIRYSGSCEHLVQLLGRPGLEILKNQLIQEQPEFARKSRLREVQNGNGSASSNTTPKHRHPEYVTVEARLRTFDNWSEHEHGTQTPAKLAEYGFFYTGHRDVVRCFACGGGHQNMKSGEDIMVEHCHWFPTCPMIIEKNVHKHNRRTPNDANNEVEKEKNPVVLHRKMASSKPAHTSTVHYSSQANVDRGVPLSSNAMCRHPKYSTTNARLQSYANWPLHIKQTPNELAEAGLFYTGDADVVRCFSCDGGLKRWEPDDDPWVEHCRWFPECCFLLETKGETYVREMRQQEIVNDQLSKGQRKTGINESSTNPKPVSRVDVHSELIHDLKELGFETGTIQAALVSLLQRGCYTPRIDDIIDIMLNIDGNGGFDVKESTTANIMEKESLESEKDRLRAALMCISCKRNESIFVFLPCRHLAVCTECAEKVSVCPLCSTEINNKVEMNSARV